MSLVGTMQGLGLLFACWCIVSAIASVIWAKGRRR